MRNMELGLFRFRVKDKNGKSVVENRIEIYAPRSSQGDLFDGLFYSSVS